MSGHILHKPHFECPRAASSWWLTYEAPDKLVGWCEIGERKVVTANVIPKHLPYHLAVWVPKKGPPHPLKQSPAPFHRAAANVSAGGGHVSSSDAKAQAGV